MNYLVYKHTSPSGKSYIGITNNYERRCTEHQVNNWCPAFYAAIKKYGWDNFTHEILFDNITEQEAIELEPQLIIEHNTKTPNGYNMCDGGKGVSGRVQTLEERQRRSVAARNRPPMPQHTYTKIIAIAAAKRGTTRPDDVKAKISASKNGHTVSKETRDKLAKTYTLTSPNGEETVIHNMSDFCRIHSLFASAMIEVFNGKRKSYKGWTRGAPTPN